MRDWTSQILHKENDAFDLALHERGVCDYDCGSTSFFENISSDAGDNYAGVAGHPLPCSYVYDFLGAFLFPAKYFAGGGRRGVDHDYSNFVHVDISYYYGICFQLYVPSRIDWNMDCHDN